MNFGVPYKGSKNKIAVEIVKFLPQADCFVDLFAGGCAITHCAIVNNKYKRYIINDIDVKFPKLFVSEYNAPSDFECVFEVKKRCCLSATDNTKITTERIFKYKG